MTTAPQSSIVPPIIGHRGAGCHAPENTLASICRAAVLGVRWVELDARLSRDFEVILLHDDTVDRTSDGSGLVAEKDWAELQALDAGAWYGEAFSGARIPSLRQAITVLAELGLGANIEIKPRAGREDVTGRIVARLLNEEWPAALPIPLISSFNLETLIAAQDVAPNIPRALAVSTIPEDWWEQLVELGSNALHCDHKHISVGQVLEVIDAKCVLRCFTVNEADRARTLYDWGVEAVFTDYPERMPMR